MLTFRNKFNNLVKNGSGVYTVQEIIDYFDKDSIFALLFLITFPTSIPAPPQAFGAETVFGGTITLLLSIQLIMGFDKPYLPEFITSKKINLGYLKNNKYYEKADSAMKKIESIFKKRYTFIFHPFFVKIIALIMMAPAVLMAIPFFFTNLFPSQAVTLISFAYLLKDGLMMIIASVLTVLMSLVYLIFFKKIVEWGKRWMKNRRRGRRGRR